MARRPPPLTAELLVSAYCQGIFPMADDDGEIGWYSPDPRAVFPLDAFHVPSSLRRSIRKAPFELRIDTCFEAVMRGCQDRERTWISDEIIEVYVSLHERGLAHSLEAFRDGKLCGGLYGVAIGGAFFGESMFSLEPEASKQCLVALVERLRARGFVLLDSQLPTDHLRRFGQVLVPRRDFLRQLAAALKLRPSFTDPPPT